MMVKRYTGKTAEEALSLAKWELGDDAVILSSGKRRDRWWKFWENGFSVLVATDAPGDRPAPVRAPAPVEPLRVSPAVAIPAPVPAPEWTGRLEALMRQMEHRLAEVALAEPGEEVRQFLCERGMEDGPAQAIAERVMTQQGKRSWQETLPLILAQKWSQVRPISTDPPSEVVMVGPTGSGKTTTLVKLAAYLHLERKMPVLMVTTDTFRLGAVEQLESFAELLHIPFKVAHRAKDLPDLVRDFAGHVVLVDTPGHSIRHPLHMAEIQSIERFSQRGEVMLTIPATMAPAEMRAVKAGFLGDRPGTICITKADESHLPGGVLGVLWESDCPLGYITDGQGVPEDIQVASAEQLCQWLMRGEYHG